MKDIEKSELKPKETVENLEFLVEHFRKLAIDKDGVIIQYRDVLEKLKPVVVEQEKLVFQLLRRNREIEDLRIEITKLKCELEKIKSKKKAKE